MFTLVWLFIFWIFNYLFANNEYYYKNLTVNADIQQDWTIQVNEIFDAYFNVPKHGIIRNIPLKYAIEGKKFRIFLEKIKVDGKNFSTYENNGEKEIKIWDVDNELTGDQRYSIHYSVYGLIRNFAGKGREELSWNIIPNGFDTHIDQVRIELKLPKVYTGFTSGDFLLAADGKSNKLKDFEWTIDWSQGDKIILTYDKRISAGKGITIAIKFPVGYFTFDHKRQESLIDKTSFWQKLSKNMNNIINTFHLDIWFRIRLILVLLVTFFVLEDVLKERYMMKKNESLQGRPLCVEYYPPQGLTSAEVWVLWENGSVLTRHVISLFYQRYNDKIIDITYKEEKKELVFRKLKNLDEAPMKDKAKYEKKLFEYTFRNNKGYEISYIYTPSVMVDEIVLKKWVSLPAIVWSQDRLKEYFLEEKKWVKQYYYKNFFSFILWRMGIIPWTLLLPHYSSVSREMVIFCCMFAVAIVVGIWNLMPRDHPYIFTQEGLEMRYKVLWYKLFLEKCDEAQLCTFLAQDPFFIDKTLPFAVALWLDTLLLQKIKSCAFIQQLPTHISPSHFSSVNNIIETTAYVKTYGPVRSSSSHHSSSSSHDSDYSSYDRDSWFSSWSSRDSGSSSWSSWCGWWWGGGRSW